MKLKIPDKNRIRLFIAHARIESSRGQSLVGTYLVFLLGKYTDSIILFIGVTTMFGLIGLIDYKILKFWQWENTAGFEVNPEWVKMKQDLNDIKIALNTLLISNNDKEE